jgi:transcriptional regulator with XRE-family HTH domain
MFSIADMEQRPIDRALMWAKERGWSQSDLAREIGVTPQDITNWKKRGMPPEWYEKTAEVLERAVDELLGRKAGPQQPSTEQWKKTAQEAAKAFGDMQMTPALFIACIDWLMIHQPPEDPAERAQYMRQLYELLKRSRH